MVAAGLLAGCYAPSTPADIACAESGACPHGQICVSGGCRTDGSTDASPVQPDATVADAGLDAPAGACAGGDGVCLVACLVDDPDCNTTCGDGRCVGNAGELCGNCSADCATTAVVCGNGDCEAGETPDCYADCGPSPWTWSAEEQQLLAMINGARTGGFTCPGGAQVTRPAFTVDTGAMHAGAREWAWEVAHHDFAVNGGAACNGRTLMQRKITAGAFNSYMRASGYADIQAVFDNWMGTQSSCDIIMSSSTTTIAVAVTYEVDNAYVVLTK